MNKLSFGFLFLEEYLNFLDEQLQITKTKIKIKLKIIGNVVV